MDCRGQFNPLRLVLRSLLISSLVGSCIGSDAASAMDTLDNIGTRPIISDMDDQEVNVGSTVTFDCQVMSLTAPTFEWWKTDESGSDREIEAIPHKIDIFVNTPWQENVYSQMLRIYGIILEDAGSYKCTASNDVGTSSESALLIVDEASPPFMNDLNNPVVIVGSTVTINCQVMSLTEPAIHWWKTDKSGRDDHELSSIPGKMAILDPSQRENIYSRALKIYSVTFEDAGTYTCIAANELGSSRETAELTVNPAPRGGCMKFGAPGTLALTLMAVCGYALGNHLFFD